MAGTRHALARPGSSEASAGRVGDRPREPGDDEESATRNIIRPPSPTLSEPTLSSSAQGGEGVSRGVWTEAAEVICE